jgi:hypothetical protein
MNWTADEFGDYVPTFCKCTGEKHVHAAHTGCPRDPVEPCACGAMMRMEDSCCEECDYGEEVNDGK